ncbi:hypothetical protein [Candidatus Agathobaculum pullicola]|uniref:hypothetical protein n=1 Tax=Candidatus Agathobaculum pullicola TaxID=2838426 RepID=UPI003F939065
MQTKQKPTSNQMPGATPAAPVDPFAVDAAQTAQMPPNEQAAQSGQQTYPVPVDGEMRELTLDELIQAASLGLSKQNAYIRRNRAANGMPNGQIYAAFVEEYPDVRPDEIPPQVWEWAQQEGSLVSAYRKWEILTLKDELAALEMNQKNRRAAVGPAQSDGEPAGVDPVTLALLGK